jgi:predicted DNA-binding transcriptional regulator YafY
MHHPRMVKRRAAMMPFLEEGVLCAYLAVIFGVSVRTIYRDIAALRVQGYRINGSAGAGGGVRLVRSMHHARSQEIA